MNIQETTKNNVLIAKFIGLRMGRQSLLTFIIEDGQEVLPKDLKYHESWEWLMPVVDKTESFGNKVSVSEAYCDITSSKGDQLCDIGGGDYTKLSATYEAVVLFVKSNNH